MIFMVKIDSYKGYDYYTGWDALNVVYYNIVPSDQPAPTGGYYAKEWICAIKKLPDLFIH